MQKTIYTTIFLLFAFLNATAQGGKISGKVWSKDQEIINWATVYIEELKQESFTKEDGSYLFENVPFGEYTLVVIGASKENVKQKVKHKSAHTYHNFKIAIDNNELEGVTVLEKTQKTKIETEGYAVNVIKTDKAALQSIQTNELLDRTAGVRIRQDGGLGSHIHYNINGLTGNAVKIFIDGVPSTNYGPSFSLNSIPPALIERIEVYKGVLPGYLSEDALGGAINVILKSNRKQTLNASYSYGSFNTHQFNVNGAYRSKKGLTLDASLFYNYSDNNYEVWGEQITHLDHLGGVYPNQRARRFNDAYRSIGSKVDIGVVNKKWTDKFTIGGVFSDDYKEIQHGITMYRPFGNRHSLRNANVATLSYFKKDLFVKGLSLNVNSSYSFLKSQVIDTIGLRYDWSGNPIWNPQTGKYMEYSNGAELGSRKTTEINSDNTFAVRANLSYELSENHLFYVNFLYNNFNRSVVDDFLPLGLQLLQNTRDLQKDVTTFTYVNLAFDKKLRTNLFYKLYNQKVTAKAPRQLSATPPQYVVDEEHKKESFNGFGATVSFALMKKLTLLGSVEKAIRFPSALEIFGNASDNLMPGTVEAEKSLNANIGAVMGPYSYKAHSISVNTSVFFRDTKGMIRQGFAANNSATSYYENLEDVLSKGIDFGLDYNYANKVNFNFNISKFDVLFNTQFDKFGAPYLFYRTQIRNEPSFKYNANIAYYYNDLFQKKSRASIYLNASYVKGFLRNWSNVGRNNLETIPSQFVNDIGVLYTFPSQKISISFDAKNIFNQQVFDNFGLQKPGRAFYGKITYNIL